ncbi:MAG: toll/interleukin-1 receptor domain-containing protein [Anaerolineae bacterium]
MTRPHVFLSYVSKDIDVMWRVYTDLQAEGLTVWIDQTNLEPGTLAWDRAIEDAIVQASYFVVLLSPSARRAEWVREELHYAKTLEKRIFPLLVAGDAQTSIPFGFSTAQYTDIRGENYENGMQKLVETLCKYLGIESRSALKERQRRARKQADQIARQRHDIEEAKTQAQAYAHQRQLVHDQIEQNIQQEQALKDRMEWIVRQRQELQEDYRLVCRQEKQANELLINLTNNLRQMETDVLDDETQPQQAFGYRENLEDHDWNSELPGFAELSQEDETVSTAEWRQVPPAPTSLPEEPPMLLGGFPELPAPETDQGSKPRKRRF